MMKGGAPWLPPFLARPSFWGEGRMEKVQKREGLICICAECQKVIRMIGTVSGEEKPLISHGICSACADRLYGDIFRKES